MEIGAAAAGVTAGVHALWGYNRKNFLFDREMRQKNEYQVLEWRCKQAALWRDDVRDIIGLTEKKMDTYTVVSALQLAMCVGLFTEGRLAPGTPPWLLHFYMLTLSAGFLYLLMSVWLAMHASIVAQCSSVRLLTQFVRLPVPTWEELENMRTYAQSFEQLGGRHMLRVPFMSAAPSGSGPGALSREDSALLSRSEPALNTMCGDESSGRQSQALGAQTPAVDPWECELHGDERDIYELQEVPAALRHHIKLAERAAEKYKCFDAFARVAMTFGTNQLLQAITYYCLGYVSVQDGAPWAAWCVGTIMATISVAMIHLDISMKRSEQTIAQVLVLAGPVCVSCATWLWARNDKEAGSTVMILLPMAYAAHALWLLWALRACGVERLPCGSVLPTRFRAVLYLDVFGWINKDEESERLGSVPSKEGYRRLAPEYTPYEQDATGQSRSEQLPDSPDSPDDASPGDVMQLQQDLKERIALWQSDKVQHVMEEQDKARVAELARRFQSAAGPADEQPASGSRSAPAAPEGGLSLSEDASPSSVVADLPHRRSWLKLQGFSDFGTEAPYLFDPESGAVRDIDEAPTSSVGADEDTLEKVRTITFDEEQVERLCTRLGTMGQQADASPTGEGGALLPTIAGELGGCSQDTMGAASVAEGLFCCAAPGAPSLKRHELWIPGLESHPEHNEEEAEAEEAEVKDEEAQASGPAGTIPQAPARAFAPSSFTPAPARKKALSKEGKEPELVTGHDRMRPGELPWKVFRSATHLLVVIWSLGLFVPFGAFRELMTNPVIAEISVQSMTADGKTGVERFAVGTDPSGLPEYIPEADRVPELPEGELIRATWPSHSGFKPRALSRASHGQQLVVADDFGVYVGHLFAEQLESEPEVKSLRGSAEPEPTEPTVVHSVHFRKAPPCDALEGHALKDISVACSDGARPVCRVLVLHTHGKRLVECPLFNPEGPPPEMTGMASGLMPSGEELLRPSRPSLMWEISSDWLHGHSHSKRESVDSVAVNSECLVDAFDPQEVGCVVVGTTSGRIVQLRGHVTNETRLVPERAVQQCSQAVDHGSLHVFPNGYVVALHKRRLGVGTIEALDAVSGKSVGEWRLPKCKGVKWMTVSGGGDYFYVMGRSTEDDGEFSLYRFPVPEALQSQKGEAATLPFNSRDF